MHSGPAELAQTRLILPMTARVMATAFPEIVAPGAYPGTGALSGKTRYFLCEQPWSRVRARHSTDQLFGARLRAMFARVSSQMRTDSGVAGLGEIGWGSHYCHFYDGGAELADALLPYIKAGLDANEACVWVTSEPMTAQDARAALRARVADVDRREASGQLEILALDTRYQRSMLHDPDATVRVWLDREQRALAAGYGGLRVTGNMHWLEPNDWSAFMRYESLLDRAFRGRRIIGMCSYCLGRCSARGALEVVQRHGFSVTRHGQGWQVVDGGALASAREDVRSLQDATRKLRESDKRKDEFMAILGHELRNPLSPIATAAQLMRLRGAADAFESELQVIERQTRHLSRLVDDLLDVSRITSDKVELQREPVELADVVARAVSMTAPLVEQRSHSLQVHVPRGVVLELDGDRFTQIIGNLLTNAAKYTPPGSAIAITTRVQPDAVELTVADDGPGIPAELQPHVFEPFVQGARSADRQHGGLGLGLPIVKRLVELHGGQITLASSSAGTAITISVPPSAAACPTRARRDDAPTARDARGTVLVVDDNEDAATMLAEALRTAGYEVHGASDGPEALRIASEHRPQIAILDIGLPHMDGYQLAAALRELRGLASLTLLALTGYNGPSEREQARRAGFVEHFTKPVSVHVLLAALKRLGERS